MIWKRYFYSDSDLFDDLEQRAGFFYDKDERAHDADYRKEGGKAAWKPDDQIFDFAFHFSGSPFQPEPGRLLFIIY